jgi:heme exporter protein CcmD
MSLHDFIAMNGYGYYVWGSYLASAALLVIEVLGVRARLAKARQGAKGRESAP